MQKKVFFGFDLSINRKSLKCPFLSEIVLKAFGLLLTQAGTQPGVSNEQGLLTDAFPLVLFPFWFNSLSGR